MWFMCCLLVRVGQRTSGPVLWYRRPHDPDHNVLRPGGPSRRTAAGAFEHTENRGTGGCGPRSNFAEKYWRREEREDCQPLLNAQLLHPDIERAAAFRPARAAEGSV